MQTRTAVFKDTVGLVPGEIEAVKLALDFALMLLSQQNMFCGEEYQDIIEQMKSALEKLRSAE